MPEPTLAIRRNAWEDAESAGGVQFSLEPANDPDDPADFASWEGAIALTLGRVLARLLNYVYTATEWNGGRIYTGAGNIDSTARDPLGFVLARCQITAELFGAGYLDLTVSQDGMTPDAEAAVTAALARAVGEVLALEEDRQTWAAVLTRQHYRAGSLCPDCKRQASHYAKGCDNPVGVEPADGWSADAAQTRRQALIANGEGGDDGAAGEMPAGSGIAHEVAPFGDPSLDATKDTPQGYLPSGSQMESSLDAIEADYWSRHADADAVHDPRCWGEGTESHARYCPKPAVAR